MNVSENSFLSFDSFQRKFNLKCTFLQYFGLLAAIPRQWKDLLNVQGSQETPTSQLTIDKLDCKDLYNLIINYKSLPPPTAEERLIECGYDASKRRIIYSLPSVRVTKEIKLAIFQYKIIHNVLYSNSLLQKMKRVNSPDCPFCANTEQTTLHLFVTCPVTISFWSDFIQWYHQICKKKPVLTKNEIMYGVLQDFTSLYTLNHLILMGKYFLYKCALNESSYQFADFIALVREKIDLER